MISDRVEPVPTVSSFGRAALWFDALRENGVISPHEQGAPSPCREAWQISSRTDCLRLTMLSSVRHLTHNQHTKCKTKASGYHAQAAELQFCGSQQRGMADFANLALIKCQKGRSIAFLRCILRRSATQRSTSGHEPAGRSFHIPVIRNRVPHRCTLSP